MKTKGNAAERAKARQLAFQALGLAPKHKLGTTFALSKVQRKILWQAEHKHPNLWAYVMKHWPKTAARSVSLLLRRGMLKQTGPTTLEITPHGTTALLKYLANQHKYGKTR